MHGAHVTGWRLACRRLNTTNLRLSGVAEPQTAEYTLHSQVGQLKLCKISRSVSSPQCETYTQFEQPYTHMSLLLHNYGYTILTVHVTLAGYCFFIPALLASYCNADMVLASRS